MGNKIDRDVFFAFLCRKADDRGLVEVHAISLAELLHCDRNLITKIMKELVDQGRVKYVKREFGGAKFYRILNSESATQSSVKSKRERRRIVWE